MKKLIITLGLVLFLGFNTQAQNVVRRGKNVEQKTTQKSEAIKTRYVYFDKDGVKYPIYLSYEGKAFIIKVCKTTGKEYREYLPTVTSQLSKIRKERYENSDREKRYPRKKRF